MVRNRTSPRKSSGARNIAISALFAAVLTACGGGGGSDGGGAPRGGSGSSGTDTGSSTPVKQSGTVSGKLSYDFVPTATRTDNDGNIQASLDYARTERRAVRHALVEVMSEDGTRVIGKTVSDDAGVYTISVPADTRVYVRVTAQASSGSDSAPDYLIGVRDNTAPEYRRTPKSAPLYSMRGEAFTTQASGTQADLNAASGWTGNGYGATRSAAPFAILDQLTSAAQKVRAAAPDVALPALNAFWSTNNRPAAGDVAQGLLTNSHYDFGNKGLYILGAENVDTDEYDSSVIVHEFAHYLEDNVSRSDSLGGTHTAGDALDMTVAFSEGFGNAFSSMMRDTPVYTDTIGPQQGETGVVMKLDGLSEWAYPVWFDEEAVGKLLYGLYKSPDVGFAPIYQAMLHGQKNTPAFTSVFSFASALRPGLSDVGKTVLDESLAGIQVQGGALLDDWGTATKTGDWSPLPFDAAIFPLYTPLAPGASATSCTTTLFGAGNKLGNYGRLRLHIPAMGFYRLTLTPVQGGPAVADYSMAVYGRSSPVTSVATTSDSTSYSFFAAGDYAANVLPRANAVATTAPDAGLRCVTVSLQAGM